MLNRAYSLIELKSVDEEQRILEGIATTPTADRVGDIIESRGAQFNLPIPLLWQHRGDSPIGRVLGATVTDTGIKIRAQIEKGLLPEIDRAWALIKSGLVRGLSIGFKGLESEPIDPKNPFWGGQRFKKWEWLELSAVTIPANGEATIQIIKSIDAAEIAAIGKPARPDLSGVSDSPRVVKAITPKARDAMKKTVSEHKQAFVAEKVAKVEKLNSLMPEDGTTLGEGSPEQQEFDSLEKEIAAIDVHLARLETLDRVNRQAAVAVKAADPAEAAASRSGTLPVITLQEQLPKGIGFARAVKTAVVARLEGRNMLEVAKEMYPSDNRLHGHINHVQSLPRIVQQIKATVAAGTTTNSVWASALVDPTNLAEEFIEYLRPATIIGKFGTGNIPQLRRVPFNVRMIEQTTGGTGYWVGQGAPKPLTSFEFAPVTLAFTKVAAISVITEELARFSSPSAEQLVRDGLRDALVERIDRDFIDPAEAGSANVQPASITNGLTAQTSAGTSADNARTDLANLMDTFLQSNQDVSGVVIIMPTSLALSLSFQVNSLGQPEFPGLGMAGGMLNGIPVITSQYAANASGAGNLVIVLNAREIFLADDGQVTIDASREASLQMLDNPTNNSATGTATTMVSMWQTNSIALRAERFINWAKRRSTAVVYMDDVNWGSIGSPS